MGILCYAMLGLKSEVDSAGSLHQFVLDLFGFEIWIHRNPAGSLQFMDISDLHRSPFDAMICDLLARRHDMD